MDGQIIDLFNTTPCLRFTVKFISHIVPEELPVADVMELSPAVLTVPALLVELDTALKLAPHQLQPAGEEQVERPVRVYLHRRETCARVRLECGDTEGWYGQGAGKGGTFHALASLDSLPETKQNSVSTKVITNTSY